MRTHLWRGWRRWLVAAAVPLLLLLAAVLAWDVPALPSGSVGVRVETRDGALLAVVRGSDGARQQWVEYEAIPGLFREALFAAEDGRYGMHPGVDPLATVRAAFQNLRAGRVVAGGSTLTQQLARTLRARRRTLLGKAGEALTALGLELRHDKRTLLQAYCNQVSFGGNTVGVGAAAWRLFGKDVGALTLPEVATLAALPRGPSYYDPWRHPERLLARRNWVLGRMAARGVVTMERAVEASSLPLGLAPGAFPQGAPHFLRRLAAEAKDLRGTIRVTLRSDLQSSAERMTARAVQSARGRGASAAAVLIIDNEHSEVLAYVGSPDYWSEEGLGQNDGVRALRSPGSTLKPFLYGEAINAGLVTAATPLPDLPIRLAGEQGVYEPKNYDGRYHGPVSVRQALASSLNLPAVALVQRLGVPRFLERLHAWGFESLTETAEHYGVALSLGDGEVSLEQLAAAYASLGRGGVWRELRWLRGEGPGEERRLLRPESAAVITSILRDDLARASSFGRGSALAFPFPVATKTGTSTHYRDNWAVGYTSRTTVAVWVGNFDGAPMMGQSGVVGAAPLMHELLRLAEATAAGPSLSDAAMARLEEQTVCADSGALAGPHCPHQRREWFAGGTAPEEECRWHREAWIDPRNGLLAGPACARRQRVVGEQLPALYGDWARASGRPQLPQAESPACPLSAVGEELVITSPPDGAAYRWDPTLAASVQKLLLTVRGGVR